MEEDNASHKTLQTLIIEAEKIVEENLKSGKSPQAAITIACISLSVNPDPLEDNAVLDALWEKIYRERNF